MGIRCIIVEDERVAREGLQVYIGQYDFLEIVGSFSNASDALSFLEVETVQLLFLDIEMPGIKGIEMARRLHDLFPLIVFTTAYPQYALEGYEVNAIGYLIKPIFPEDFARVVQKVKRFFSDIKKDSSDQLLVRSEGEWLRLHPQDILYIRSMQNYVLIHLKTGKPLMILQSLKELYKLLPACFIQTHRSYVVNLKQVHKISEDSVFMGNCSIPISRTRKKEVMRLFVEFL